MKLVHKLWIGLIAVCLIIVCGFMVQEAYAQGQHGILLTWIQSTSPGITANSVFTGPHNGPYTLITKSSAPITSYEVTLTPANQGTQACFVVTASATGLLDSQYSTETCNTFPVQAGVPSSVQSTPN